MTLEHEVRAKLAERYADLVDRASTSSDGPALLRAGDKLTELLDTLPIRAPGGGDSGDSGDGGRGRVLELLDRPPTVGDSSHP
jgi:hypothetical protein